MTPLANQREGFFYLSPLGTVCAESQGCPIHLLALALPSGEFYLSDPKRQK
jgi:hypothetical protein